MVQISRNWPTADLVTFGPLISMVWTRIYFLFFVRILRDIHISSMNPAKASYTIPLKTCDVCAITDFTCMVCRRKCKKKPAQDTPPGGWNLLANMHPLRIVHLGPYFEVYPLTFSVITFEGVKIRISSALIMIPERKRDKNMWTTFLDPPL